MKAGLVTIVALVLGSTIASARITKVEIDSPALSFLRRHLVSGGDFYFLDEAATSKFSGTAGYIMEVAGDGSVQKLKLIMQSGNAAVDERVRQTLQGYRFKPGTKGPLQWYISFFWPDRIKVILAMGAVQPGQALFGRKP